MPMRVIATERCRDMFEPPEGERTTPNLNLSKRLKPTFSDQALGRRVGYCWSRMASGTVSPFIEVASQIGINEHDQVRDLSPTTVTPINGHHQTSLIGPVRAIGTATTMVVPVACSFGKPRLAKCGSHSIGQVRVARGERVA